MPDLLLTGGAGFIGSALTRRLVAEGWRVRVLDRLSIGGRREHLAGVDCELRIGDVCEPSVVRESLEGCEALIHLAAESHVERSLVDPGAFLRTNIEGTRVVLDAACRAGTPRVLIMSTDEVLGQQPEGAAPGPDAPLRPGNPYAASKAGAEALVHAWRHSFGLPAAIARCVNCFGPRQHPEKAVPWWAREALSGRPVPVQGEGSAVRDWLPVEDLARGLAMAIAHEPGPWTWHFAAHRQRTNRTMAEEVAAACQGRTGQPTRWSALPERQGQDTRYALDDAETRARLGWSPLLSHEEGIRRTVAWIAEEGLSLWS